MENFVPVTQPFLLPVRRLPAHQRIPQLSRPDFGHTGQLAGRLEDLAPDAVTADLSDARHDPARGQPEAEAGPRTMNTMPQRCGLRGIRRAFCEPRHLHPLQASDLVRTIGFGVGLPWGVSVFEFVGRDRDTPPVFPSN